MSIKIIHKEFSKMDMSQKSVLNSIAMRLFTRTISIKEYIEEAAVNDIVLASLCNLYLIITELPEIREIDAEQARPICLILSNSWTLHSSKSDEEMQDDTLPLFIFKICDLLYSFDKNHPQADIIGTKRKSLLLDFDWVNPHIAMYTGYPEFWMKLISLNLQAYKADSSILKWASQNMNLHLEDTTPRTRSRRTSSNKIYSEAELGDSQMMSEDGFFDAPLLALAGRVLEEEPSSPTSITTATLTELSFRDVCRWKIYTGDSMDSINKFCKNASLKFHLPSSLVYKVLTNLEDCFLWNLKFVEHKKNEIERENVFSKVFQFLDASSGLNLTMACKKFRVVYRIPYLQAVLLNGRFSQDTRIAIWMQFLGGVGCSNEANYVKAIEVRSIGRPSISRAHSHGFVTVDGFL